MREGEGEGVGVGVGGGERERENDKYYSIPPPSLPNSPPLPPPKRCRVVDMDSTVDYRGLKVNRGDKWYHDDDKGFELCWSSIPGTESSRTLIVSGRDVKIDRTKGEHCVLEFDEFCRKPRGAADYLALGEEFKSVMIRGVPKMRIEDFNVLRRFIVLIDCLYSEGVKLTVSSEAQVRAGCGSGGWRGVLSNSFFLSRLCTQLTSVSSGCIRPGR